MTGEETRLMSIEALTPESVVAVVASSGSVVVTLRLSVVSVGRFTTKEPAKSNVWSAAVVVNEREYSGWSAPRYSGVIVIVEPARSDVAVREYSTE